VQIKVEVGKEVIWKEGLNLLNHFPKTVLMGFEKGKKDFNLLA
jgi:hypothetical protein